MQYSLLRRIASRDGVAAFLEPGYDGGCDDPGGVLLGTTGEGRNAQLGPQPQGDMLTQGD